jgi:hypothetical protein
MRSAAADWRDHLRMLGGDECGLATRGLADVVGHAVAFAPVHPQTAGSAPEEGPQHVGPGGVVGTSRRSLRDVVAGDRAAGGLLRTSPWKPGRRGPVPRTRSTAQADSSCLPASAPAGSTPGSRCTSACAGSPITLGGPTCRSVVEDPVTPAAGSAQGRRLAWPGDHRGSSREPRSPSPKSGSRTSTASQQSWPRPPTNSDPARVCPPWARAMPFSRPFAGRAPSLIPASRQALAPQSRSSLRSR